MKSFLILITSRLFKPFISWYVSKPRYYRYGGIRIMVLPGVFHPGFFFSTKVLLNHLKQISLKDRSFLELGAGTGLISLFAASRGALATASDISSIAFENIKKNQALNQVAFPVIRSDLFKSFPQGVFDIIVINPPYYKKNPASEAEYAWYCGENAEYFTKLFSSLKNFIHLQSQVIMVLSDVCDLPLILSVANEHQLAMTVLSRHQLLLETNFIYSIRPVSRQ